MPPEAAKNTHEVDRVGKPLVVSGDAGGGFC